ncbi:MAG: response regulator [Fimbriimonadaceae bacterium]|nr:response regulator [Fimbriimonadaceae bacterium]QYK54948.1 MAG: response regulator [Fimbriimonadaceae bacterium]
MIRWRQQPWLDSWGPYLVAVLGVALVTAIRLPLREYTGLQGGLSLYGVPVAVAALVGGIRPGIFAVILGLFIGTYLFVPPGGFEPRAPNEIFSISGATLTWILIAMICDFAVSRARAERQALHRQRDVENQLGELLDRITDAFFTVGPDYKIIMANRAVVDLFGVPAEETTGQELWTVWKRGGDAAVRLRMEQAMQTGSPVTVEFDDFSNHRAFELRLFPAPDQSTLAVFAQNITAKKRLEEARERLLADERAARSDAEQESRSKDEFVATLSHELRTPMTAIVGWSEILRPKAADDRELAEGLAAIESSARLQSQLIDDLLDISRIVTGQLRLHWQIVDLREIVDDVIRDRTPFAAERRRTLSCRPCDNDLYMRGDELRLTQIVTNLVANALKFTDDGGNIVVELYREGSSAVLSVTDDGQGIDSDALPFIFDRFRQANVGINRKHGGLGLGLAIVKQLVEAHEGSVSAESSGPGMGSKFTVRLPLLASGLPTTHAVEEEPKPTDLTGIKVLLVEDDPATRRVIQKMLTMAGASVEACASGREGLNSLSRQVPDVLVSDIGMPEMDGYRFIANVRAFAKEDVARLPSLALTAFARAEDRNRAIEAGFDVHLSKPVQADSLVATVSRLARTARAK